MGIHRGTNTNQNFIRKGQNCFDAMVLLIRLALWNLLRLLKVLLKVYSIEFAILVHFVNTLGFRYEWRGNYPEDVGQHGEDTVPCMLSKRVQLHGIDKQVMEWLQRLDLIDSYRLDPVLDTEKDYEFLARKYKGWYRSQTHRCRLRCVRRSYPCWFSAITCLKEVSSSLNNPEAHLHPKVQSELADLLIEVVKNRQLQIILESHSEHLLIRLMRRIAEEQISADDTAFYFCEMNEGVSEIERLNVDDYGKHHELATKLLW